MLDCGPVAPAVMAAGYACTMPGVIKLPPRIDRPYSFAYRPLILTFRPRRRPATFPMSSAPYTSCSTTSQKLHPLTWPTTRLTMKIGWSSIGRRSRHRSAATWGPQLCRPPSRVSRRHYMTGLLLTRIMRCENKTTRREGRRARVHMITSRPGVLAGRR
ncbi:hypothetical protein IEO21_03900 [Rhodonia placenta]|uniref:Uncharacterized protein n=1 Tax=Rhodonia placenta TaxID=104341 RepID=A0A8H7P4R0_9APHY|nr:hypothetical protein IEO21_03900 [Postia placenta]